MTTEPSSSPAAAPQKSRRAILFDLLLLLVLAAGAFFRFSGLLWGEYQYLHPDERFLVWVGSDISPVLRCEDTSYSTADCPTGKKVWVGPAEYFDTAKSPLNPHNRGHGFYVYGTLPMFITRYAVEFIYGHSGFDEMTNAGRALSAVADLLTVLLVYLIAERLYDRRVALLAAAFSAAAVLQIQQSHFFTMDTFIVFFTMLAFYLAIRVMTYKDQGPAKKGQGQPAPVLNEQASGDTLSPTPPLPLSPSLPLAPSPLLWLSLAFGVALGAAVASKLNAAPMALALPVAFAVRLFGRPRREWNTPAWRARLVQAVLCVAAAAAVSLLVFRIAQPYAFSGPGFFGVKPNPLWISNLKDLRAQSNGDMDFPPAMQWARRTKLFSFQNLTTWGLGLPLGLAAWAGFLWVGWRIFAGRRWRRHLLIWGWTGAYFLWQSMAFNPTMRYQLPIYPTLAIFAAWALVALWDRAFKERGHGIVGDREPDPSPSPAGIAVAETTPPLSLSPSHPPAPQALRAPPAPQVLRASPAPQVLSAPPASQVLALAALSLTALILLATYGYAYAFSRIYTRPITRVAASRWIYQNVPGPVNLHIQTSDGPFNQPLPYPYTYKITVGTPYLYNFSARVAGQLTEVYFPHIAQAALVTDEDLPHPQALKTLILTISAQPNGAQPLAYASITDDLISGSDSRGDPYLFPFAEPVTLEKGRTYYLKLELAGQDVAAVLDGALTLSIEDTGGLPASRTLPAPAYTLRPFMPYRAFFAAAEDGLLDGLGIPRLTEVTGQAQPQGLVVTITAPGEAEPLASASLQLDSQPNPSGYTLSFDSPIPVQQGETYAIEIALQEGQGQVAISGAGLANEGDWDDPLPLRLDGYDGFGGIYPLDLNFNMYWDDTPDKLERFLRILDQSDYIAISSNRQWGSLTRIPERYPMVTTYYRNLLGCPPEKEITWCYSVAKPGMFSGSLGFELAQTFQSNPRLGPIQLNDQFAEEAFTVYDHPKVLIFRKTAAYDPQAVRAILSLVDFSSIVRLPPLRFPSRPIDLMLPPTRLAEQRQGGTWSQLFDVNALPNRFEALGVVAWYLSLFLLGLLAYPMLRLALPGLPDHGYPLARTAGLLLLSWLVWVAGSARLPVTRLAIAAAVLLMALLAALLAYRQRDGLRLEWRTRRRYFLAVEGLALAFFLLDLLIRYGNPDLWHQWKGGEKPMDFAYFNAVLKSTTFPPYDPWFAGGYLNYYYYGFVFVGMLVKLLGIVPAFAYNLILPTIFTLIALGAFSIGYNLLSASSKDQENGEREPSSQLAISTSPPPILAGLSAALAVALLGNLGVVRMIYRGYQMLAAPGGQIQGAALPTRLVWAIQGFVKAIGGAALPYGTGDWYWIPSRAIAAPNDVEPITEFPFFTVLYADPHAHLFALPITLLALGLILGVVLGGGRWRSLLPALGWFFFAGLAVGALRPTNTWDFYPYLALGAVALLYAFSSAGLPERLRLFAARRQVGEPLLRLGLALGAVALFAALSFFLFQPFARWYGQAYSKVDLWKGTHTMLGDYLTHWGLFLFVIVAWLLWETRDWMAATPLSSLRRLLRSQGWLIVTAVALLLILVAVVTYLGAGIAWFVLLLAAWAGVLLLRPGQPGGKRFVLFLIGTALTLTLMVEIIVLRGDIGRMNTVFKFYLQAWTFLGVSAAAALGWLLLSINAWLPRWRTAFWVTLALLAGSAALFPLMGGMAKVKDRMVPAAPHTLDGMLYMNYATYEWQGVMDLSQDYRAIRWMQEHVPGSPVIVEANLRDLYRWGSRYSIYTGLPGVVGWEWHQQQQRALLPGSIVSERIAQIAAFYNTSDLGVARSFLHKYDVRYIIVGQLERNVYDPTGLEKFPAADGALWRQVYHDTATSIYEVIQ